MQLKRIEILKIIVPFKTHFKHGKKNRSSSENIIIKIFSSSKFGYGECLPREYVTGEDTKSCINDIEIFFRDFKKINFTSSNHLIEEILRYYKKLPKNKIAAFSGFESALVNLYAKENNISIKDILKYFKLDCIPKSPRYTIPIGETNFFGFFKRFLVSKYLRINDFKIKLSPNSYKKQILLSNFFFKNKNLRFDANYSFSKDSIFDLFNYLIMHKNYYLEEGFKIEEKDFTLVPKEIKYILDESICSYSEVKTFKKVNRFDFSINLRIGKQGGIIPLIYVFSEFKKMGIDCIFGCLVGETINSRYHVILSKYLNCIFYEGNYDLFLLKNVFIKNPKIVKFGLIEDFNFDLDTEFNISIPNKLILSEKILK